MIAPRRDRREFREIQGLHLLRCRTDVGVLPYTMFGFIAGPLIATGIAWALVRFMALAQDGSLSTGQRRRWRVALSTALTIVGLVSTLYVWTISFGYPMVPLIPVSTWADFILVFALPVLVAFALVYYLSRLRRGIDNGRQEET